ncbi:nickel transporter [Hyphomicrobium nitrativorans NL23]|uniref:Nickel transporter n=1 Tax=Hyphomicrobium nitrativorans NL23 TaxID=1029756 RepID=V5SGR8_9HYPH|nr:HisA/HisF-related TIM barrel protein [Hyphomicrobium nitrativorans]AHB49149.1 nickel transporter [Hyphomicrobium nitrativorans NL23]
MRLIPVIDIRGGEAVAASRGDRANYRPLRTPLAEGSDPVAVARALHGLFPFPTLYVADLDGIEGRGADLATQRRIADAWPGREVWIDDGCGHDANAGTLPLLSSPTRGEERSSLPLARQIPSPLWGGLGWGEARPQPLNKSQLLYPDTISRVVGSETLKAIEDYTQTREAAGLDAPLSLDFRGEAFLGPPELLANTDLWPARIIVMTLARVGSGEGPDIARLASIVARAGAREVYAAGGVRNADDLNALRDIGVAGALISTALHAGTITRDDLEALGAETDG